jgi:hypothetical protein
LGRLQPERLLEAFKHVQASQTDLHVNGSLKAAGSLDPHPTFGAGVSPPGPSRFACQRPTGSPRLQLPRESVPRSLSFKAPSPYRWNRLFQRYGQGDCASYYFLRFTPWAGAPRNNPSVLKSSSTSGQ